MKGSGGVELSLWKLCANVCEKHNVIRLMLRLVDLLKDNVTVQFVWCRAEMCLTQGRTPSRKMFITWTNYKFNACFMLSVHRLFRSFSCSNHCSVRHLLVHFYSSHTLLLWWTWLLVTVITYSSKAGNNGREVPANHVSREFINMNFPTLFSNKHSKPC